MIATIKLWDHERGYGFFQAQNGKDFFAHIKNWLDDEPPAVGQVVEFEIGPGFKERKEQAINIRVVGKVAPGLVAMLQGGV